MSYDEYLKLVKLANDWMWAYYYDTPLATDSEYDELIRQIKAYEEQNKDKIDPNSPTQKVAPTIQDDFKKIKHQKRMWSMEDVFDDAELLAWANRAKALDEEFFIEPKFDGASLNLTYENGKLKSAATRGDGEIGEDVTLNAMVIDSIPKTIPYLDMIEIRGEVVIFKDDFEKINQSRKEQNQSLFSNPRNAASGSLRQLDTSITRQRNLKFFPWGVGQNNLTYQKHSEVMEFVRNLGFLVDDFCHKAKFDDIKSLYESLSKQRESKPMMLDGMVVRIDDIKKCEELGYTVKFPRFMAAFKFKAIEATTKLIGVNIQVGRTGVLTPVGVLEPVMIDGVRVSNVTLHNFDEIQRLELMIGDIVGVVRSGDVIPKITSVFKDRRSDNLSPILRPTACVNCGEEVLDDGTRIICQNLKCSAKAMQSIIYFASKKCLNIDGLGENIIKLLFNENKIKSPKDIFSLTYDDFIGLEGFKDKKINNILSAIQEAKNCELSSFINALGCEHIGEVAAKKIASSFGFDWLYKTYDDFISLDGFGEQMAKSLVEFCHVNKDLILEFYEVLSLTNEITQIKEHLFNAKTFVITGTLSRPRDEFVKLLEGVGAKTSGSVSKKTDYLLCGEDAGSKLEKAKTLGVKILSEDEFQALYES